MANRPIAHGVVLLTPAGVEYTAGGDAATGLVQGPVAHDAVYSGNPVPIGGFAATSAPAVVASGDTVRVWYGLSGQTIIGLPAYTGLDTVSNAGLAAMIDSATGAARILASAGWVYNGTTWDRARGNTAGTIVIPPAPWTYAVGTAGILVSTTTAVTIKASAGAGLRNYVTSMQIGHPTLGGTTELVIRDGAAGTVIWRDFLQTTAGESRAIPLPGLLAGTAATLLEIVTLTSVTGGIYFNAQGFAAP